ADPWKWRQAALGRVLLSNGRRNGLRLLSAPERRHRLAVQSDPVGLSEGKGLELADDEAESWRLRQGPHSSRRPCHDHASWLASGLDEHREPVEGDAKCGVLGLTEESRATKKARNGEKLLRACPIFGS